MYIEPHSYARDAIARFLWEDHNQLAFIFESATLAFNEGRIDEGAKAFQTFRENLEQHLRMEEEILFPKLEHLAQASSGAEVIANLRSEHKTIRWLVDQITDILALGDNPASAANQLEVLLEEHALAEEPTLYQLTDRLADSALGSELVQSLRGL